MIAAGSECPSENELVRVVNAKVLNEYSTDIIKRALNPKCPKLKLFAVQAAEQLNIRSAYPQLIDLCWYSLDDHSVSAVNLLAKWNIQESIPILIQEIARETKQSYDRTRFFASRYKRLALIEALGVLRAKEAEALFRTATNDKTFFCTIGRDEDCYKIAFAAKKSLCEIGVKDYCKTKNPWWKFW